MTTDVLVLGAGIVGVSIAAHLQMRGRSVLLVDKREPGLETSFGNAGLIQREGVYPYAFPQNPAELLDVALNQGIRAHYHLGALPGLAGFLAQYWRNSRPERHHEIARLYEPLIAHCVAEHLALAERSGGTDLIRRTGWMQLYRTEEAFARERERAEGVRREFGVAFSALSPDELEREEPALNEELAGAIHWTDPASVTDPHALTMSYFGLFERLGGRAATGDAATLRERGAGWRIRTDEGEAEAAEAVVALGAWSDLVTGPLGYEIPLAVKRGYHMHYGPSGNAVLNRPVLDAERGYLLAPMARGIRLTTGAEFAERDAPKTPVQLERAEPIARGLFPLGERLDPQPWMGLRPCTPDMMPVIGPAPRHKGLWFAFGHAHHGLTLGPVTGRLIAELVAGETPFIDPTPYRADRF